MFSASQNPFNKILKTLQKPGDGGEFGKYYSLPALNDSRIGSSLAHSFSCCNIDNVKMNLDCEISVLFSDALPYSIRILLESAIRNCDEFQVKANDVEKIIDWKNTSPKLVEIPFKPARVLLQVSSVDNVAFFECYLYLLL